MNLFYFKKQLTDALEIQHRMFTFLQDILKTLKALIKVRDLTVDR